MHDQLKIGIDIHGVIDAYPERFKKLTAVLVAGGAQVHIVTGSRRDKNIDIMLAKHEITFTHYFSIVDYLVSTGKDVTWKNGKPYADETAWNNAKRDYCQSQNIDLMIDDSAIYRDTFHDISTTYLHLISKL
ncbi:hypothetical protein TDB9533_00564 [Thalassocella blandensis]|nr:hypothetical protein TDB9533_00564 [Thalassocella blandensis]